MEPGEWFAGRFEIIGEVGRGSAGRVYRARDIVSHSIVALKVFAATRGADLERFARESTVLATLRHDNLVEYVAHGATASGRRWLALEWLDGQTLRERLKHGALTTRAALELGRGLASGLLHLHQRGVVHRDVKPENVILVKRQAAQAKLLDLSIAHMRRAPTKLTDQQQVMGSPGYLAPEQARGDAEIDGRADLFSLGALLYECVSGARAFARSDVVSSLLATVLDEPQPLARVAPETPSELAELIHRMLAKQPDERPELRDVEATLFRLREALPTETLRVPSVWGVGARERRFLSIVLARASTDAAYSGIERAEQEIRGLGAELRRLSDGTFFVGTEGAGSPTEAAIRAARAASVLSAWVHDAKVVIVSGRTGEPDGDHSVAKMIERAAALLESKVFERKPLLDRTTASILESRFEVRQRRDDTFELVPEDRTLVRKISPFVGRERELATVLSMVEACASRPSPRATLFTGPPGIGKSRLMAELLPAVRAGQPGSKVSIARADPCAAGAPLRVLQQLMLRDLSFDRAAPLADRRERLWTLAEAWAAPDPTTTAAFWGEILGTRFDENEVARLAAARRDPRRMADELASAVATWLGKAAHSGMVLLVIDDLQWGDWGSLNLLDTAMRLRPTDPVFLLALGRLDTFWAIPELSGLSHWAKHVLAPVPNEACRRLVHDSCGPDVEESVVERLVARAGGNPFFLEELLRTFSASGCDSMPEAVVALVEGRIRALSPDERRTLRAASVLGKSFTVEGATYVCGLQVDSEAVAAHCNALISREILMEGDDASTFVFANDLLREASYGMLTEADRVAGHRLAGEWLEQERAADASTLAYHFERGGLAEHAARHYGDAAARALDANDFHSAIGFTEKAVACGAHGRTAGLLALLAAQCHRWRGEHASANDRATAALAELEPGEASYFAALAEVAAARGRLGLMEELAETYRLFQASPSPAPGTPAASRRSAAAAFLSLHLLTCGETKLAITLLEDLETLSPESLEPETKARLAQVRAFRALFEGDIAAYKRGAEEAATEFERAGDVREACVQRVNVGNACVQLGAYQLAEAALEHALSEASKMQLENVVGYAKQNLALASARSGAVPEGLKLIRETIELFKAQRDRRMVGTSRVYASLIERAAGRLEAAIAEAEQATIDLEVATSAQACAFAALAMARVAAARAHAPGPGRDLLVAAASGAASEARRMLEDLGGIEEGEGLVRCAVLEAQLLLGSADAGELSRKAAERLQELASRIGEGSLRRSFLQNVPEHARILEIASELAAETR